MSSIHNTTQSTEWKEQSTFVLQVGGWWHLVIQHICFRLVPLVREQQTVIEALNPALSHSYYYGAVLYSTGLNLSKATIHSLTKVLVVGGNICLPIMVDVLQVMSCDLKNVLQSQGFLFKFKSNTKDRPVKKICPLGKTASSVPPLPSVARTYRQRSDDKILSLWPEASWFHMHLRTFCLQAVFVMDKLSFKSDQACRSSQSYPSRSHGHCPHECWSLPVGWQSFQLEHPWAPHPGTPRRLGILDCLLAGKLDNSQDPFPSPEVQGTNPLTGKTPTYRQHANGYQDTWGPPPLTNSNSRLGHSPVLLQGTASRT